MKAATRCGVLISKNHIAEVSASAQIVARCKGIPIAVASVLGVISTSVCPGHSVACGLACLHRKCLSLAAGAAWCALLVRPGVARYLCDPGAPPFQRSSIGVFRFAVWSHARLRAPSA